MYDRYDGNTHNIQHRPGRTVKGAEVNSLRFSQLGEINNYTRFTYVLYALIKYVHTMYYRWRT